MQNPAQGVDSGVRAAPVFLLGIRSRRCPSVAGNGPEARGAQREEAAADPADRSQNAHRALDGSPAVSVEPGFQGARQPSRRPGARGADPTGRERPLKELGDSASMFSAPSHS